MNSTPENTSAPSAPPRENPLLLDCLSQGAWHDEAYAEGLAAVLRAIRGIAREGDACLR